MAAFFSEVLDESISPAFLEGVCRKFHYEITQLDELRDVAVEMLYVMRDEAFWESKRVHTRKPCQDEAPDAVYEYVVMSLGKEIDSLQDGYSEKGLLTQSYMIEVLASELLLKGYAAYSRHVRRSLDRHVAGYHFPGGEEAFPLEILPELLKELTSQVTCNSAFCMLPKKSVVFISELTRDENLHCKGICAGCNRIHCPNRTADDHSVGNCILKMTDMPLTYGYSRIFGVI